jgi:mono/diheme cytochrome c family protein
MENNKESPMKHFIKTYMTLAACILMGLSCMPRRSEPIKGRAFTAANAQMANGEKQFMAHCQKCHPGGEAGLGIAINANPAPQFVKKFQVRHGLGVMPSFKKDEISKSDLEDISKYMYAWKHY